MPDAVLLAIALAAPATPRAFRDTFALHAGGPPAAAGLSFAAFRQVWQHTAVMKAFAHRVIMRVGTFYYVLILL